MFSVDDIVWAKSSVGKEIFWPSEVIEPDSDVDIYPKNKRPVIAYVRFLVENTCEAIKSSKKIEPFNCDKKDAFIERGRKLRNQARRLQFESAVRYAKKCTTLQVSGKRKKIQIKAKLEARIPQSQRSTFLDQDESRTLVESPETEVKQSLPTILEENEDLSATDNDTSKDQNKIDKVKMSKKQGRPKRNIGKAKSGTACEVYSGNLETTIATSSSSPTRGLTEQSENSTDETTLENIKSNDIEKSSKKTKGKITRFKSEITVRIRKKLKSSSEKNVVTSNALVNGNEIKPGDCLETIAKECEPARDKTVLKRTRNKIENNDGKDGRDRRKTKRSRRTLCEEENTSTENCTAKMDEELTNQKTGLKAQNSSRQNKTKDVSESLCVQNNRNMKADQSSVETKQSLSAVDGSEASSCSNGLGHSALDALQTKGGCDGSGVASEKTDNEKGDDSSDDESLPDVFSSSPVAKKNFLPGDVVWVKHMKFPFWPAQINRGSNKNKPYFYVKFLPKSECKGIKVNKKNIKSFTENYETFQQYRDQEVDPALYKEFKEAVEQAEEILRRRVFPKDDVLQNDIEDQVSDPSDDDKRSLSSSDEQDQPVGEPDEPDKNVEDGESGFDSSEMETENLENGQSPRKRKKTTPYDNIVSELHRCKQRLLDIYRERLPSSRHETFKYGTVSDKNSLKRLGGFGPIQYERTREKIIRLLKTWHDEETKQESVTFDYVWDVWLPEALIYYIQMTDNLSAEEAENLYLDHARHADKRDVEEAKTYLKKKKIDRATMEETVERAKQKNSFYLRLLSFDSYELKKALT